MIPPSGGSIAEDAFALGTFKPELTILYTDPVDTDKGTFSFSVDNYTANESPADGLNTVTVTVNRIGGSDGAATVNWAVSDGTARHRARWPISRELPRVRSALLMANCSRHSP